MLTTKEVTEKIVALKNDPFFRAALFKYPIDSLCKKHIVFIMKKAGYTFQEISRRLNRTNHATSIYHYRNADYVFKNERKFIQELRDLNFYLEEIEELSNKIKKDFLSELSKKYEVREDIIEKIIEEFKKV